MPYYLYRDVDDNRVYAYDDPQPDLAARPGWILETDQATPDAIAAIAMLEGLRARAQHEAALIAAATAERLAREAGQASPHITVTEDPGPGAPIRRVRLAYPIEVASADLEEVRVGPDDPGEVTTRRNEWGALRGTPTEDYPDDALVRGITRAGLGSGRNGCAVEIENAARTMVVYGRRWRDGALIRNGIVMSDVLVLGTSDPVPAGTPANTLIVRRAA